MHIFGALIPNASVREAFKVEAMQKLGNEFHCRLLKKFFLPRPRFSRLFFLCTLPEINKMERKEGASPLSSRLSCGKSEGGGNE